MPSAHAWFPAPRAPAPALCRPTLHCPAPPADRGAYIDQSQSFNVHMSDPNFGKLTSLHFYAWKKGLKTGGSAPQTCALALHLCLPLPVLLVHFALASACFNTWACCHVSLVLLQPTLRPSPPSAGMYYLRTRAAADAIKFTVDQQALQRRKTERLAKAGSSGELKENKPAATAKASAAEHDAERERQLAAMVCSLENKDACVMCSG